MTKQKEKYCFISILPVRVRRGNENKLKAKNKQASKQAKKGPRYREILRWELGHNTCGQDFWLQQMIPWGPKSPWKRGCHSSVRVLGGMAMKKRWAHIWETRKSGPVFKEGDGASCKLRRDLISIWNQILEQVSEEQGLWGLIQASSGHWWSAWGLWESKAHHSQPSSSPPLSLFWSE